jgi:pimeloyl-ACP methyl ester carboxylesterase
MPEPRAAAAAAAEPWLLHIPGVSGESIVDHTLVHGLVDGGFRPADIQIYDCTEHDGGIPALQATERHKKHARKIAEEITQEFRAEPTRPVYLISHSGGAGLAAWALEDLPADVKIERALFLAPALSPEYDLSKALSHVSDKAYVLYSAGDTVVLSVGTKTFGTIDGVYTEAAGVAGFKMPRTAADPTQYRKLIQLPYDASWAQFDNFGSHIGPMATPFAAHVLVPLLQGKGPTTAPSTQPRRRRG